MRRPALFCCVWLAVFAIVGGIIAPQIVLGQSNPATQLATQLVPLEPPSKLQFPPLRFNPPQPTRTTLSNGMVVYLLEDHELPLVSLQALVRTGSLVEPENLVGLARITGSVLRSGGTESRPPDSLNERLEFLAASVESSVGYTSGSVGLSTLTKDLDEGVEIFADVLRHPAFREKKLRLAKQQTIEGIRRQNDSPNSIAFREFRRLVYPNHPRGRTATIESVSRISRDDLVRFYRRYYYPRNIMLSVSGDFASTAMLAKLEEVLGTWKDDRRAMSPAPPPRGETTPSLNHVLKELPQSTIVLGHLTVAKNHPDSYPFTVLNYILGGGGFSSHLMSQVRAERGLAYSVGSSYRGAIDYGVFVAYAQTKSESTIEVIQLMRRIMKRVAEGKITADELEWAKDSIINRFIFSFSSPAQIVRQQLRLEYDGLPSDYLSAYRNHIARVTLADLQRVARAYLPNNSITLVVGDESGFASPLSTLGTVQTITLPTNQSPAN